MAKLTKESEDMAVAALERETPFRRARPGIMEMDCGPGWSGWLGLNSAYYRGATPCVSIGPVVGIIAEDVEREVAELLGTDARQAMHTPTARRNMGYLQTAGTFRKYDFHGSVEADQATALALAQDVRQSVVPWVRELASLEGLAAFFSSNREQYRYDMRQAIVLAKLGKQGEAHSLLERRRDEYQQMDGRVSPDYMMFMRRFGDKWSSR